MDIVHKYGDRIGFAILALGNIFALVLIWIVAANTKDSMCALKADVERRHDAGVEFLLKHPTGIPGFTRADILRGIKAQESTLESLEDLDC